MSLAAETRAAARAHPFLLDALRADVLNYTAAARFLDVGDTDAVAAALRRFAMELGTYDEPDDVHRGVRMERGFGAGDPADALVFVGETALVPDAGSLTAVFVRSELSAGRFGTVLGRPDTADVQVEAAALGDGLGIVVVPEADGPAALRAIDDPPA